ncbi:uncharacterized protein LOC143891022 [Tasmannia lanceolata]|uniref:uncharacterized protein LOC143891022 n=1 Tax=Tasmannia lanceolata TaxID=3420 RepID=UPI004063DB15
MRIIALVISWTRCLPSFQFVLAFNLWEGWRKVCFSSERLSSIVQRWEPPPLGMFKLNFDGASFGNPGPAEVGGLCHNGEGVVQWAFFGSIGVCDDSEAEVKVVFHGIKKIIGDCLDKVIIEGDSLNVIQWLKGGVAPRWRFLPFIDEIHEIISGSSAILKHVRRAANEKADLLAKRGVNSDSLQLFDYLPP